MHQNQKLLRLWGEWKHEMEGADRDEAMANKLADATTEALVRRHELHHGRGLANISERLVRADHLAAVAQDKAAMKEATFGGARSRKRRRGRGRSRRQRWRSRRRRHRRVRSRGRGGRGRKAK